MAITDVSSAEGAGWRFVDNLAVGGTSAVPHPKWGYRARKYEEITVGHGEVWIEECHSASAAVVTNLNDRQKKGQ